MKRRTNARTILRLEIEITNLSLSLSRADQSYLIISNGEKRVSGLRNHLGLADFCSQRCNDNRKIEQPPHSERDSR